MSRPWHVLDLVYTASQVQFSSVAERFRCERALTYVDNVIEVGVDEYEADQL